MSQTMSLVVYGSMLGKTSERFVVKKEGKVIDEKPFFRVSEIVVPSRGVTVSAGAIFEAVARGIRISFLGPTGTPYALLSSSALVATVETRRQQLAALADRRGLEFARAVVTGKIKNQARLLRYFDKYEAGVDAERSQALQEIAGQLETQAAAAAAIEADCVSEVRSQLLGVEGGAARVYWRGVAMLLDGAAPFEGGKRCSMPTCVPPREMLSGAFERWLSARTSRHQPTARQNATAANSAVSATTYIERSEDRSRRWQTRSCREWAALASSLAFSTVSGLSGSPSSRNCGTI